MLLIRSVKAIAKFTTLSLLASAMTSALPSGAQAASSGPRSCLQIFNVNPISPASTGRQTPATAPAGAAAKPAGEITPPNDFRLDVFENARARYVSKGMTEKARTREEKVAAIAATLERMDARDIIDIEEWVRSANSDDLKRFVKSIGRIDPKKGIGPKRAEQLLASIVELRFQSKPTFRGLITRGFSDQQKRALEAWAATEFMKKPFEKALDDLVGINDPGIRDVLRRRTESHPNVNNVLHNIFWNSFFMNLFPAQLAGLPLPYLLPRIDILKNRALQPSVRARITRTGSIDAAYPSIYARYGKIARFETAWNYARHVMTGAAIAYAFTQIYPGFMTSIMPPGYIDKDHDSTITMGAKVIDYYSRLALLIRWEGIKDEIWPSSKNQAQQPQGPQAPPPPQLPDARPPDANSQAATDQTLNGNSADRGASNDYQPPAFDPAPEMPADVPASALPPAPAASAPVSATEPGARAAEF